MSLAVQWLTGSSVCFLQYSGLQDHLYVSWNTLQSAMVPSLDPVANKPGLQDESLEGGAKSTA